MVTRLQKKSSKAWQKIKQTVWSGSSGTHLKGLNSIAQKVDLCKFKASLAYKVISKTIRATQKNPLKNPKVPNICFVATGVLGDNSPGCH